MDCHSREKDSPKSRLYCLIRPYFLVVYSGILQSCYLSYPSCLARCRGCSRSTKSYLSVNLPHRFLLSLMKNFLQCLSHRLLPSLTNCFSLCLKHHCWSILKHPLLLYLTRRFLACLRMYLLPIPPHRYCHWQNHYLPKVYR